MLYGVIPALVHAPGRPPVSVRAESRVVRDSVPIRSIGIIPGLTRNLVVASRRIGIPVVEGCTMFTRPAGCVRLSPRT